MNLFQVCWLICAAINVVVVGYASKKSDHDGGLIVFGLLLAFAMGPIFTLMSVGEFLAIRSLK